jgi:membrane protease YdiL (CAAX protease family)/ribosomal protein S18 acetylase RimI-like enzyme
MTRLSHWISTHQVSSYFILAFLFSWPLFVLVLVALPHNMAVQGTLGTLAVFGPAIAAVIVAGISEPARGGGNARAQWTVFAITWVLAGGTLVLFASGVRGAPVGPPIVLFGAVLGLLPAFVTSRAFSSVSGIRRCFRSLVVPRGNVLWYLLALLAFPAIQLAGAAIDGLLAAGTDTQPDLNVTFDPFPAALLFLHGFFFAGGVNEETGWRGFAIRRLQGRHSPLVAALVVWVFWALWHLPVDLASGDNASSALMNRVFFNAMWSILFVWVFNRTKQSVLAPALFHPAMNTSGEMLPRTDAATVLFVILVVYSVISDRMWITLPEARHTSAGASMPTAGSPETSEEFEEYYDLRWRILREPWGQPRGSERDDLDPTSDHVTARDDAGRLVGVGRLHFNSEEEAQIRYMATEEDARGTGVGRAVVERLEAIARERGARRIFLNAREIAVGFYERLGYRVTGEGPTVFGVIKHSRMEKDL